VFPSSFASNKFVFIVCIGFIACVVCDRSMCQQKKAIYLALSTNVGTTSISRNDTLRIRVRLLNTGHDSVVVYGFDPSWLEHWVDPNGPPGSLFRTGLSLILKNSAGRVYSRQLIRADASASFENLDSTYKALMDEYSKQTTEFRERLFSSRKIVKPGGVLETSLMILLDEFDLSIGTYEVTVFFHCDEALVRTIGWSDLSFIGTLKSNTTRFRVTANEWK